MEDGTVEDRRGGAGRGMVVEVAEDVLEVGMCAREGRVPAADGVACVGAVAVLMGWHAVRCLMLWIIVCGC